MPQFQPGQSGNPAGRRAEGTPAFRAACRKRVPAALKALDPALKVPARAVKAAEVLLAYAYGKPVQMLAGSPDHPAIEIELSGGVGIYRPAIWIPDNGRDPEHHGGLWTQDTNGEFHRETEAKAEAPAKAEPLNDGERA